MVKLPISHIFTTAIVHDIVYAPGIEGLLEFTINEFLEVRIYCVPVEAAN